MPHLTHTGPFAGVPICGNLMGMHEKGNAHATYAPLNNTEWRKTVCPLCLAAWINSFDEHETLPPWATEILQFELKAQAPEDLRALAYARHRIEREAKKAQTAADRKAQADEMLAHFALAGSDRPEDDPHQQPLF